MSRYNIYNINFTRESKKQFESLPAKIKKEVATILENEIAKDPFSGKPLQGPLTGLRSYRVGTLRIIYQIIKGELIIIVLSIEHRKKVYQKLKLKKK